MLRRNPEFFRDQLHNADQPRRGSHPDVVGHVVLLLELVFSERHRFADMAGSVKEDGRATFPSMVTGLKDLFRSLGSAELDSSQLPTFLLKVLELPHP